MYTQYLTLCKRLHLQSNISYDTTEAYIAYRLDCILRRHHCRTINELNKKIETKSLKQFIKLCA